MNHFARCITVCLLIIPLFAEDFPKDLPTHWDSKQSAVVVATQIWRLGYDFVSKTNADVLGIEKETKPFSETEDDEISEIVYISGVSNGTRSFLSPNKTFLYPVIQFSCAIGLQPYETTLMNALKDGDNEKKLLALAILMNKRAPRSAPEQWATLQDLRKVYKDGPGKTLLDDMAKAFEVEALANQIDNAHTHERHWAIRAVGPTQAKALIPRLAELSTSEDLYTSLAAEASLEEMSGAEADEALARCAAAWRYNASNHAARQLLNRDRKELLRKTLLKHPSPEKSRYEYRILLGLCDDPNAVPILCETVHNISIADGQMFSLIEKLATREHLPLLRQMLDRVRPNQLESAKRTISKVEKRLAPVQ